MENTKGYKQYEDSKGNIVIEFLHIKNGAGAHIRTVCKTSGEVEILTVSILEDLWHDYLHFKKKAIETAKDDSPFIKRRYTRAAMVFLFAYFDAVVNSWWEFYQLLSGKNKANKRKSFYNKFEYLNSLAKANISTVDVQKLKRIRNKVVHFEIGYDLFVFDEAGLTKLLESEKLVLRWIKEVGNKLNLLPMIDTTKLGRKMMKDMTGHYGNEFRYNKDTVDK